MYAASFALVVIALVTLVVGVFQSGLTFIWVSIGSSVAAALFLAAGILQKKPVEPATAGAPYGPAPGSAEPVTMAEPAAEATATQVIPAESEPVAAQAAAPSGRAAARPAARPSRAAPARATPAKAVPTRTAARASTTARAAAAKPAATRTAGQVVALPERGTYHLPGCRFVKGRRDTERISKSAASRRGYSPCGICRP